MQDEDKKRTEEFSRLLQCAVEAEKRVMSTITSCHDDILNVAQSISWTGVMLDLCIYNTSLKITLRISFNSVTIRTWCERRGRRIRSYVCDAFAG